MRFLRWSCLRWEESLYLSISEDLPEIEARGLDDHLARCARCREEVAQAERLREECMLIPWRRQVAPGLRPRRAKQSPLLRGRRCVFPPLSPRGDVGVFPPLSPRGDVGVFPPLSPRGDGGHAQAGGAPSRRLGLAAAAAAVLIALGGLLLFGIVPPPSPRGDGGEFPPVSLRVDGGGTPTSVVDARWAAKWNEFVSDSGAGRAASLDARSAQGSGPIGPLALHIPHPERIDF